MELIVITLSLVAIACIFFMKDIRFLKLTALIWAVTSLAQYVLR